MPSVEVSYSKKIGLRNYSSHSFSISIKTEVPTVADVEKQSNQLYALLQETVDRNLENEVGYVPEANDTGSSPEPSYTNGNGTRNYRSSGSGSSSGRGDYWKCSDKQKELIEKIIDEHRLDTRDVEQLSDELHRKPLKSLNKLEMSAVIQELIEKYGPAKPTDGNRNGNGRRQYQGGGSRR